MKKFLVDFGFEKLVIFAEDIDSAFEFVVDEFGVYSDPIVREIDVVDVNRFMDKNIPFIRLYGKRDVTVEDLFGVPDFGRDTFE